MNPTRRNFTPDQKALIVRRHLSGTEPISNLADELAIQPSQIHYWVKQVLDQAERAFQYGPGRPPRTEQVKDRKIERLQAKLIQKNEVIAELVEEHVKLKKSLGSGGTVCNY
jgi:transposase